MRNIRKQIEQAGGEVRFNTQLTALHFENGRLTQAEITRPQPTQTLRGRSTNCPESAQAEGRQAEAVQAKALQPASANPRSAKPKSFSLESAQLETPQSGVGKPETVKPEPSPS